MTNKRISAVLLTGLILMSFAGCAVSEQPKETAEVNTTQSSTADVTSDNKISDDIPAVSAPQTEKAETESKTDNPSKPAETGQKEEKPAQNTTEPDHTASKAENAQQTSSQPPVSKPTEPPKPAEPETPPQETEKPTEPPTPEFDISYWISYAKSYAEDIGLKLDSEAVWCWDTPITAGSGCIYLERDIQSRLNRYNRDEDISAVWIWAEPRANGDYDLYIGYA